VRESDWAIAGAEAKIKMIGKNRYFMVSKKSGPAEFRQAHFSS
jgi:hypothetical protein